jgi:hypothetical protein
VILNVWEFVKNMEFCSSLSQSEIVDGDEQVMAVVFNKLGK